MITKKTVQNVKEKARNQFALINKKQYTLIVNMMETIL